MTLRYRSLLFMHVLLMDLSRITAIPNHHKFLLQFPLDCLSGGCQDVMQNETTTAPGENISMIYSLSCSFASASINSYYTIRGRERKVEQWTFSSATGRITGRTKLHRELATKQHRKSSFIEREAGFFKFRDYDPLLRFSSHHIMRQKKSERRWLNFNVLRRLRILFIAFHRRTRISCSMDGSALVRRR